MNDYGKGLELLRFLGGVEDPGDAPGVARTLTGDEHRERA